MYWPDSAAGAGQGSCAGRVSVNLCLGAGGLIGQRNCIEYSLGTNSALAQATLPRDKYAMQFRCDLISERLLQLHKMHSKIIFEKAH